MPKKLLPTKQDLFVNGGIITGLEDITDTCAGINGVISMVKSTSLMRGHFSINLCKVVVLKFKRCVALNFLKEGNDFKKISMVDSRCSLGHFEISTSSTPSKERIGGKPCKIPLPH